MVSELCLKQDIQMEETTSDTDWKSNIVYEPMEKRLGISFAEKKTVDKGGPDEMVGAAEAYQNAECTAQARQRRQRHIYYTPKWLRPRYLQGKAQEYLMEHPNATWNELSTHLINKDVIYQVSTGFPIDEEQNRAQMASLGQALKILRTELRDHRINAVEETQKPIEPIRKKYRRLQGFADVVEPVDTLLVSAEKRYESKKSTSCKMKPRPRKRLRSPKIATKDVDPPMDLGIGLAETMMTKHAGHQLILSSSLIMEL